jgi:nucleolar protein 12
MILPLQPLLKQLQRHILSQIPTAKIESTRFRSIPFQTPTSKLPTSDDEETPSKTKPQTPKQGRAHDRERTSTWREQKGGEKEKDDDTGKNDEKKYLNPKQKKKIAFINQEFHSSANTLHAYIVFAHPLPPETRPSNLPPPPPTLDPYEAAQLAAQKCDATLFMDRMIRVDLVNKKVLLSGEGKVSVESSVLDTDPKLSVFVGNLDFASKEEDLRVFFEGVVSAERGPPPADASSEDEGDEAGGASKKLTTWVSRVRIVRDKDTQLGKGFAYVQFTVRASQADSSKLLN